MLCPAGPGRRGHWIWSQDDSLCRYYIRCLIRPRTGAGRRLCERARILLGGWTRRGAGSRACQSETGHCFVLPAAIPSGCMHHRPPAARRGPQPREHGWPFGDAWRPASAPVARCRAGGWATRWAKTVQGTLASIAIERHASRVAGRGVPKQRTLHFSTHYLHLEGRRLCGRVFSGAKPSGGQLRAQCLLIENACKSVLSLCSDGSRIP